MLWRTLAGLAFVIAIAAVVIVYFRSSTPPSAVWEAPVSLDGPVTRSVTLYFGNASGTGLVSENRELVASTDVETSLQRVVDELLRGPASERGVPLFDPRASVRSVFVDADGALVLDFAGAPFPAIASDRTCDLAIGSLMRVLDERFPAIRRVTLLVDGLPLHELEERLALPREIDPERWLATAAGGPS
jgi:hypothetical protein